MVAGTGGRFDPGAGGAAAVNGTGGQLAVGGGPGQGGGGGAAGSSPTSSGGAGGDAGAAGRSAAGGASPAASGGSTSSGGMPGTGGTPAAGGKGGSGEAGGAPAAGTGGLGGGSGGGKIGSGGTSGMGGGGATGGMPGSGGRVSSNGGSGSAGAGGAPGDLAQLSFETSTQSWFVAAGNFTNLRRSTVRHFAGAAALGATLQFTGGSSGATNTLAVDDLGSTTPPGPGSVITFHVYLPASAPAIDWVQPFLQDSSLAYFGAYTVRQSLTFGDWNTIKLTVPSTAKATFHLIGIEVHTSGSTSLSDDVFVDSIDW
ncbi:MAG TPA: hypothetical protein VIU64_08280 [Polyangia bacterium]